MELRHRGNRPDINHQMESFQISESSDNVKDEPDDEAIRNQKCLSALPTFLVLLAVFLVLNVVVYEMDNKLPGTVETNSSYNDFVAKRAMSTLVKLANFGPRPVGSYENEKLAFNLFKTEIENIMSDANNLYDVQMLNQKVSGSFILDMKNWKYLLSYEDLQNVVVKLNPKQGVNDSILLNCHYDTVPAGPGVSDNGVNCAVMVELLRILAKSPGLRRPVIFLFNGGEEIILQASHGFVTQHTWARDAKYVINLDSCGAGGREILFQTTVTDSYLVDVYAGSVPHPHGQAIGEELFQSGVIPSDTDFRVFRDFGNMSGLDLAHYKNGYVYHTARDDLNQIEPAVLQNTGENLFELVKALSTCNATTKNHRIKYVFFDVLGVYMFSYTQLSGTVANYLIVFMSIFSICLSLKFTAARMNRQKYSEHLLTTVVVGPLCTFFLAVASSTLVAFLSDLSSSSMSWYACPVNLVVYFLTACLAVLAASVFQPRTNSITDAQWTVSLMNGIQFFWTVLLFGATLAGLRSAYVFAVMVLPPSIVGCALGMLNTHQTPSRAWAFLYAASLILPSTFVCYLTHIFVTLFVPIAGRMGPDVNPDYAMAALMAVSAYATVGYVSPIAVLVKNPRALLAIVAGCTLLSVVLAFATPLGFPYSASANQRFDLVHTRRTFYGHDRSVRRNDSGVLVVNWDWRGSLAVADHVPRMAKAVRVDCAGELMCGVPLVGKLAALSGWIPTARPPTLPSASRTVQAAVVTVAADSGPSRQRRMEFNVTGPERIVVYVSPYPGTRLKSWSFPDKPEVTTRWQGNDVYVIRHSSGTVKNGPGWQFWLEQESDYGFDERTVNVTVTYSWVVHKQLVFELEDEFETLVNSFPPWAHVNYAVASVDAFVF